LRAILDYLVRSRDTVQAAIDDPAFVAVIRDIVEATASAIGPGDVYIAISTSGRSPNTLREIDVARQQRIVTVGFTGMTGGEMPSRCDMCLRAPSDSTPLIQQIHITAGHIICGLVEERLFPHE